MKAIISAIKARLSKVENEKADGIKGVKIYRALLTQSSTSAPTATVLENTLGGTVVWSYTDVGIYVGTLAGAFTASKTACFPIGLSDDFDASTDFSVATLRRTGADTVEITTLTDDNTTAALANGLLTGSLVQILVYP